MEDQYPNGALVCVHAAPELVEMKIPQPKSPVASLFPSADEAMEYQYEVGALVCVHATPELVEV